MAHRTVPVELKGELCWIPFRVAEFASVGAGAAARAWHRTVVLFVVLMLAGLVPHAAGWVLA